MTLTRQALDAALDRLERDVAEWVTHLREPRIFRKQFDALCADIVSQAAPEDVEHARSRIRVILARHGPGSERQA
ncbi:MULTISPECIES: hypothetical protein [Pseudoxanthomonas]|jgi:hypothetical protein|uniref:Uncharacterized protein n=1 Tax=Pseudoxanthomonas winnipegensis TaxID=2480810 RepID=A0A4Q8LFZ4_9GAMM|nr:MULTISPECIES: hypothetical protein [Pseudoxanthomonas]TAA28347.1 hypothetical protein EA660_01810 [Pseudoxanthomonas winnipegensis]TMN24960.1 hypothetical protein FF950_04155 [Pseudoxanthomonas sp. X-1]UAY73738.1 hypothetical protein LAJ50_14800 [Pseudoxanthomonas sp. X-1]